MKQFIYPCIVVCAILICAVAISVATPQNPSETPKSADAIKAHMKYQDGIVKLNADYTQRMNALREQYIKELDTVRKKALEKDDLDEAQRLLAQKNLLKSGAIYPLPEQGFRIINAKVGLTNNWADVTEVFQKYVKDGQLHVTPSAMPLPDSFPNVYKTVIVVYSLNGRVYVATSGTDVPMNLPETQS